MKMNLRILTVTAALAALWLVTGSRAFSQTNPDATGITTNNWMVAYTNAVRESAVATLDKVSTHLTAVSLANHHLAWRTNADGVVQLKVVSFMGYWRATNSYAVGPHTLTNWDQWVTVYPDLREFCANYHGDNQVFRIKELLGLPGSASSDTVVEFWISPDFLFRPTPEPAIDSVSAGLSASANAPLIATNCRTPVFWPNWYNNNLATRYYDFSRGIGSSYPYTQLGYTFDWGSDRPKQEGLSEFVIPSGTIYTALKEPVQMEVEAILPAATYGK